MPITVWTDGIPRVRLVPGDEGYREQQEQLYGKKRTTRAKGDNEMTRKKCDDFMDAVLATRCSDQGLDPRVAAKGGDRDEATGQVVKAMRALWKELTGVDEPCPTPDERARRARWLNDPQSEEFVEEEAAVAV